MEKTIFLGGTWAGSNWREILKRMVKNENVALIDPITEKRDEEAQSYEDRLRESCDYCLYVLTPRMEGIFSIAELVDCSNKRPEKTLFSLAHDITDDDQLTVFKDSQLASLRAVAKLVEGNGGRYFRSLADVAAFIQTIKPRGSSANQS